MAKRAKNPCRCGVHGVDDAECRCTPLQVAAYANRVSGPLLDRIDIHVRLPRMKWSDLNAPASGTDSATARGLVARARAIQRERRGAGPEVLNARLASKAIRAQVRLDEKSRALLRTAVDRLGLSARGHDRVLRVARTAADLDGAGSVTGDHIAEALQYRGD